ncbi:MAG: ABC transporter permease, partial [Planctomycetota bacterium]
MMILGLNKEDLRLVVNTFKLNTRDRYLGSAIGILWAILHPLLLLGMYTFIFGFVFKSKLPGSETSLTYVIWLISGLAPWIAMAEGLTNSTNSVVGSASLLKNIVFKSEILPIAASVSGIFSMFIGLFLLIILLLIEGTGLSGYLFWLVILIPLQMLFLIGAGFFLSAINVFFRDLIQILSTALMFFLFFTPIFYTVAQMP